MEMTYADALNISKILKPVFEAGDTSNTEVLRTRLQEALFVKTGLMPEGFLNTRISADNAVSYDVSSEHEHWMSDDEMCFSDDYNFCGYLINANDYDDVPQQFGGFPDLYAFYIASTAIYCYGADGNTTLAVSTSLESSMYEGEMEEIHNAILSIVKVILNINAARKEDLEVIIPSLKISVGEYLKEVSAAYADLLGISYKAVWDNIDIFSEAITNIGECPTSNGFSDFLALFTYRNPELGRFLNFKENLKNIDTNDICYKALCRLADVLKSPFSYSSDRNVSGIADGIYYQFAIGGNITSRIRNWSLWYAKIAWDVLYPIYEKEVMCRG